MRINAKRAVIQRVVCFARALGLNDFDLTVTREPGFSKCAMNADGTFTINIQKGLRGYWLSNHVAHEMVHLKQYKRDELRGNESEPITHWKGERVLNFEDHPSDGYWLAPWEMEARALEAWLLHKWENRKNELH